MFKLSNLFGMKSANNFAEALENVKKIFGAVGDNLSEIPGIRMYATQNGDRVILDTSGKNMRITKMLNMPKSTPLEQNVKNWNSHRGEIREIRVSRTPQRRQRLVYEFDKTHPSFVNDFDMATIQNGTKQQQIFPHPISRQGQFSHLGRCVELRV